MRASIAVWRESERRVTHTLPSEGDAQKWQAKCEVFRGNLEPAIGLEPMTC